MSGETRVRSDASSRVVNDERVGQPMSGASRLLSSSNVLVIDVGTSSLKGVLFDGEGRRLFRHQVTYRVQAEGPRVEQSPYEWEAALVETCSVVDATPYEVGAVALTCQRSSLVALDGKGCPLRPAIMWQDTRSASVVEALGDRASFVAERVGARPNTVFLAPKVAWLKTHELKVYEQTASFITIADYLVFCMTGRLVTDETYGSRTLLMDLDTRRWDSELLELFGVDETLLCELVEPGSIVGTTSEEFERRCGLSKGTPVVSAGGDQQCGALGMGLIDAETATATLGTSGCVLRMAEALPGVDGANPGVSPVEIGLSVGAHAMPGAYVLESSMPTCGAFLDWLRRTLLPELKPKEGFDTLEKLAEASVPGAHGLSILPHFQGRGTPDWQSAARGAVVGLDLSSTREDMARAGYEAIAYEVAGHLELLAQVAGPASALRVGGGVSQSPLLRQILADALRLTVLSAAGEDESTAFGAWMQAAVTLGLCSGYADAFSRSTVYLDRTMPDSANAEAYVEGRARMAEAYERLYGCDVAAAQGEGV